MKKHKNSKFKDCNNCGVVLLWEDFPKAGYSKAGNIVYRGICNNCDKERGRKLHIKFKDKHHLAQKAYREEVGKQGWSLRNRVWRLANPDYYLNNAERLRRQGREKSARRRARLKDLPSERIFAEVVYERDKGVCGICNESVSINKYEIDHVIPISAGGAHLYTNVQISHKICNLQKGAKVYV